MCGVCEAVCAEEVCMCAHVCQGLRLMWGLYLNHSSTLVFEEGARSVPKLVNMTGLGWPPCSGDPLSLPSMAGITGELPHPPIIYVGPRESQVQPFCLQHKCFNQTPSHLASLRAVLSAPLLSGTSFLLMHLSISCANTSVPGPSFLLLLPRPSCCQFYTLCSPLLFAFFKKKKKVLFNVCVRAHMLVHRSQKRASNLLELEYRQLWATCGCEELELNPLQELQVHLITKPSLQTLCV